VKPNRINFATPQMRFFSEDQLDELHFKTLEVLERVGVEVDNQEALKLLEEAGARVKGPRVRIPGWLVKEALRKAPERIALCTRSGERALQLEKNQPYFGLGSDLPYTFDFETGERRKSRKSDVARAARVADRLDNIDFIMSMAIATEFDRLSYLHQFHAMVENSCKPVVFTTRDGEDLEQIIEIAAMVAGGRDELRYKPFIACYAEPISPLHHAGEGLDKLLLCAESGIPVIYTPALMAGATAPVTLAGAVVTANAELLSGLVIQQLKKQGAPFIYGGVATILDMQTSLMSYGAPEFHMNSMVLTQLSQKYQLPMFSTGGCTDSPVLDKQAALEQMFSLMTAALSGANLIHDVGYVNNGLTQSLTSLVINNEAISLVKRFLRSYQIDENTIPLDVIAEIGPRGEFLTHEHTYRNFKEELWNPDLFIRESYEDWENKGAKTLEDRAREVVQEIMSEENEAALDPAVNSRIEDYLGRV